jgi:chromate transporter
MRTITDIATALIAITTVLVLIYIKKLQEPYIILAAAVSGVVIKLII